MENKKILVVCTTDSMIWHFLIPQIRDLQSRGNIVECACSKTGFYLDELRNKFNLQVHEIPFNRQPFKLQNIKALNKLNTIVKIGDYDLIHCHEPVGGVLGRIVAKLTKTKVMYTAHGFHFYKGAPKFNWMIYYPIEKCLSYITDILITINQEDYELAKNKMKAKKIYKIPGIGVDIEKFSNISVDIDKKRKELGIPNNAILLLSVSELNKNKNQEVIIRALQRIKESNVHYCIVGKGELYGYLNELIIELNLQERVHLLGYRSDIGELCKVSDIFCFPSYREGLGIAAIEAMAAGLPLITSNVHGINDYSQNGISGYSLDPFNIDGFTNAIDILAYDINLRRTMGRRNMEFSNKFDMKIVNDTMIDIYNSLNIG